MIEITLPTQRDRPLTSQQGHLLRRRCRRLFAPEEVNPTLNAVVTFAEDARDRACCGRSPGA
ncbi:MAG: hypothetical protein R2856_20425 [Caldilineaceae bacterium]